MILLTTLADAVGARLWNRKMAENEYRFSSAHRRNAGQVYAFELTVHFGGGAAVQVCDDCAIVHGCESLQLPSECISVRVGCCAGDDKLAKAAHLAFATGYGEGVPVDNDRTALNRPLYPAASSVICHLRVHCYRGAVRGRWCEGAIPGMVHGGLIPVVVDRGRVRVLAVSSLIQIAKSACLIPSMILVSLVPVPHSWTRHSARIEWM